MNHFTKKKNWEIINDFTFGGYGKIKPELINFMNNFYKQYKIPLDPVYTGKMLFAIFELIKKNKWRWGKENFSYSYWRASRNLWNEQLLREKKITNSYILKNFS